MHLSHLVPLPGETQPSESITELWSSICQPLVKNTYYSTLGWRTLLHEDPGTEHLFIHSLCSARVRVQSAQRWSYSRLRRGDDLRNHPQRSPSIAVGQLSLSLSLHSFGGSFRSEFLVR